ncbi:NUDIX hydrolase [Sharpea azabuensis]|uniref:NUDIX hydrolase n=1 Tax=Sharpea azabuensis TaxID=322505 RepID=UPI0013DCB85F|nr:NUDIX hydrolase [Sharpea azabuensis]
MAEYIDIYNDQKELTGEKLERKTKLKEGQYMLYVLALIENKGKYLITRRTLDKKWAAGQWEIPGGGVSAGETSMQALQREVSEETGLDISLAQSDLIYSYKNIDLKRGDNYFVDMYLIHAKFDIEDVHIQEDEVLEWKMASLEEIGELEKSDGFLHYARIMQALHQ